MLQRFKPPTTHGDKSNLNHKSLYSRSYTQLESRKTSRKFGLPFSIRAVSRLKLYNFFKYLTSLFWIRRLAVVALAVSIFYIYLKLIPLLNRILDRA